MSARDDYPRLAQLTTAGIALDRESASALDEIDRLRAGMDEIVWLLTPGRTTDELEGWLHAHGARTPRV